MPASLTSTIAFTTGDETLLALGDEVPSAAHCARGPLNSVQNVHGITPIPVVLTGTTAKVWTHNYGWTPLAVRVFTFQGLPTSLVTVTTSTSAITLTPSASVDCWVLVQWDCNPIVNGVPPTNFV
jgi:hypothetical protein